MPNQLTFELLTEVYGPLSPSVQSAVDKIANSSNVEPRGAIFTRREIVDFILDLVGYTEDKSLSECRILEPSFGGGDFLIPIIRRLMTSWKQRDGQRNAIECLQESIFAVEIHQGSFDKTHGEVVKLLQSEGIAPEEARSLTNSWLHAGDFLLLPIEKKFNFAVGNPPYVRQELIPEVLLNEYRTLYSTMYDRADLYVPFIERSLSLLDKGGSFGSICADRWMKNRYGGPLRQLVSENYRLEVYVDMVNTPAFQSDVIAYPAITVISRKPAGKTRVAYRPVIDSSNFRTLAKVIKEPKLCQNTDSVHELNKVTNGSEPWLLEAAELTALVRRLESCFPLLEETGCKVGIGVATGADKAFIGAFESLDVEADRKLPLITTRDISSGEIQWQGSGVINPYSDSRDLVDLASYPRLRTFLERHRDIIASRHCVKKAPSKWYKTIDRITPELTSIPKLLIPDIKGTANVVYEEGKYYPHHNLYYITSCEWDLRALQAVLLSSVTRLFIATYSTRMRGGFLRFQAQYLRRIRLPHWSMVPEALRLELVDAAVKRDLTDCNCAAFKLYGLGRSERAALEEIINVT